MSIKRVVTISVVFSMVLVGLVATGMDPSVAKAIAIVPVLAVYMLDLLLG